MGVSEPTSAGWYRDPFGRHERRYHTGTGWTEHVRDRGRAGIDPPREVPTDATVSLRIPAPPARAATPATPAPATPAPAGNGHPDDGTAPNGTVAVADQPLTIADWPAPSNLRPTGSLPPPPPSSPRRRPRWPWVLLIAAGVAVGVSLGLLLTMGGSDSPRRTASPAPRLRGPHTITIAEYRDVNRGTTGAQLVQTLGRSPAPGTDLTARFPSMRFTPGCSYYFGETSTRTYAFCFDAANTLTAKRVEVQVARR